MVKKYQMLDLLCLVVLILGLLLSGYLSGVFRWNPSEMSLATFLLSAITYSLLCILLVFITAPWKEIFGKRR